MRVFKYVKARKKRTMHELQWDHQYALLVFLISLLGAIEGTTDDMRDSKKS